MPPLGTAHWAPPDFVEHQYPYRPGTLWLGRSASEQDAPLGYVDDRHICLVSGTRGGKGTSSIVTNLCLWPGSLVVVDPKGENATVTAARRGRGTGEYCEGMGQKVHVLDPFRVANVPDDCRARFNPLDALDPKHRETVEKAALLADCIVIVNENSNPETAFWDRHARQMVKALILHIVSAPAYEGRRNLTTLRKLILSGDQEAVEALRSMGEKEEPAHEMLWGAVIENTAFGGRISDMGADFASMLVNSPKTYEGVRAVANGNTEFMDSESMEDSVAASDFLLSDLKTDPKGVSIYLSLPQRYMNTHNRWLRMMVGLMIMEMETVSGQPACGHPVLMVLDEFAGMKRMESIETGVAQMAGYGVKLFFVLQSLEQLMAVYKDRWQTFLTNCGLKLFFNIDDNFSREYISKLMGDTEVMREVRSAGANSSESDSLSESESDNISESNSRSHSASSGVSTSYGRSVTDGTSHSFGTSVTKGKSHTTGESRGGSYSSTWGTSWSPQGFSSSHSVTKGSSGSSSTSDTESESKTRSVTDGVSHSVSSSLTRGETLTEGITEGETYGATHGTTHGMTHGVTRGETSGTAETVHKRPLCAPDEIGKLFSRIDDRGEPAYPGLGLALVSGQAPVAFRRVNYYEDYQFVGLFAPHPDHRFMAPVRTKVDADKLRELRVGLGEQLTWNVSVKKGQVVRAGDTLGIVQKALFAMIGDGKCVFSRVVAPRSGRIVEVPAEIDFPVGLAALASTAMGTKMLPASFMPKTRVGSVEILHPAGSPAPLDPFAEVKAKCMAVEAEKAWKAAEEARRKAEAARAAAQAKAAAAKRDEEAKESRIAELKESGLQWLKGTGVAGLLLTGDAAVTYFTHATSGIVIGIGVAGVAGFCAVKAAGKYFAGWDIETELDVKRNKEYMENYKRTGKI